MKACEIGDVAHENGESYSHKESRHFGMKDSFDSDTISSPQAAKKQLQYVNIQDDGLGKFRKKIMMPNRPITRSRSKKLQQVFQLFVQDYINKEGELEAHKEKRKGPCDLRSMQSKQLVHVNLIIHLGSQ